MDKIIRRNIPEERENRNDTFRVRYRNRSDFDKLKIIVTRIKTGQVLEFEFNSDELPDKDSIHFTTKVEDNKLVVIWRGGVYID